MTHSTSSAPVALKSQEGLSQQEARKKSPQQELQENHLACLPVSERARRCFASLEQSAVRPTLQRRAIIAHIFQGDARHFSAERLHAELRAKQHRLSLATVYNTLHLLTRHCWLKEIVLEKGLTLFDNNISFHHHLYNIETQEIEDIDAVPVGTLPPLPLGLSLERVDVVVRVRPSKSAVRKNNA